MELWEDIVPYQAHVKIKHLNICWKNNSLLRSSSRWKHLFTQDIIGSFMETQMLLSLMAWLYISPKVIKIDLTLLFFSSLKMCC